jgi:acetamidase/formamidase
MKNPLPSAIFLATLLCLTQTTHAQPRNLAGIWQFQLGDNDITQRVRLSQVKDSICGKFFGIDFCGTVDKSNMVRLKVGGFKYQGLLSGDSLIEGRYTDPDGRPERWVALKEKPDRPGRSVRISPTRYHRNFSSLETPLLRLSSGDTVFTTTVDAGGHDNKGIEVTWGGNPLTGPFYLENAMPGDAIAIHIVSVRTNRGNAFSGRSIMDQNLTPDYVANRKNDRIDNEWLIDSDSGQLRMKSPTNALRNYRVPLLPFLGCVGTAPSAGTGASTRNSGRFGGNMEEKTIRTGSTVILPVNVQGAYLYLGDGHAAQGDGELTGDAMETSMSVTFSVELLRYYGQDCPRVIHSDGIKSIGIAGSLDQAMRIATTDLTRWLMSDYHLTDNEAAMVMGFSAVYGIPDLVGDNISVTVGIGKGTLDQLKVK